MITLTRLSLRSAVRTVPSSRSAEARRCLQTTTTASPPHAYLRPILQGKDAVQYEKAEELEGVMALVLDRKETRNALSVRMVSVRIYAM